MNVIQLCYPKQPDFRIRKTDINSQKIDDICLETFGMIIAILHVEDKAEKSWYFEETFLLTDISMSVALSMSFLILSNVEINILD